MNRKVLSLLLLCTLLSCNKIDAPYRIDGIVENIADGQTITIATSPDGILLKEEDYSVVKDGKIHFEGSVDGCKVAYICRGSANGKQHPSMFFIEKGEIRIFIDNDCCRVTGTPINELRNIIEDTITHYVANLKKTEGQYYSQTLNDEELARLSADGLKMQENLVSYLRKEIKENIGNILGLYLLVVYNDFFTPDELNSLIEEIPSSSIDRENNPFYDTIMEIAKEQ